MIGLSDAKHLVVDRLDSLVGAGQALTSCIDLRLCEILDYQQLADGIARCDQFAMRRDDLSSFDHATQSTWRSNPLVPEAGPARRDQWLSRVTA